MKLKLKFLIPTLILLLFAPLLWIGSGDRDSEVDAAIMGPRVCPTPEYYSTWDGASSVIVCVDCTANWDATYAGPPILEATVVSDTASSLESEYGVSQGSVYYSPGSDLTSGWFYGAIYIDDVTGLGTDAGWQSWFRVYEDVDSWGWDLGYELGTGGDIDRIYLWNNETSSGCATSVVWTPSAQTWYEWKLYFNMSSDNDGTCQLWTRLASSPTWISRMNNTSFDNAVEENWDRFYVGMVSNSNMTSSLFYSERFEYRTTAQGDCYYNDN